jgi:hypothetical protein
MASIAGCKTTRASTCSSVAARLSILLPSMLP